MSAVIIPFPHVRVRPFEEHELPSDWTKEECGRYLYLTADGYNTHEDAFELVQAEHDEPPRAPSESECDYMLRHAMIAVRRLPRRHP
jgi:hypothetical protein